MKNSTDLRARRTRRWLRGALSELMQEKPYEKIKVSEIVTRAEVSRPTFYLHYESKDELLLDLFDDLFSGLREDIHAEFMRTNYDPYRMGSSLFTYGEKYIDSIRILLEAGVGPTVQEQIRAMLTEILEEYEQFEPRLKNAASVFPYIIDFLTGGVFMLLQRWIEEDQIIPSAVLADLLGDVGVLLRDKSLMIDNPAVK
jgi:AcrR family transcriptional regulator